MQKCKCGNQVAGNAKFCPKCGHQFTSGAVKFLGLSVILLTLVVVISIASSTNNPNASSARPVSTVAAAAPVAPATAKPKSPAELAALRKAYAKVIDQQLLDMGIESKTYTAGADAKTLVIEDALAGRVRQNSIQENDTLFDNLRSLGFTHLKYTNNFEGDLNYGVVWTITP
jgi:hypothetical protein